MISIKLLFVTAISAIVLAATISTPIVPATALIFVGLLALCGGQVYQTLTE